MKRGQEEKDDSNSNETIVAGSSSGKETAARFEETDENIRELSGLFGNQWGRLVEVLVETKSLALFRERGIEVHQRMDERIG